MAKFIAEGAIYQEAEVVKMMPKRAVFRMVMQTCEEINQNKRMYPRRVLTEGINNCKDRIKSRALYCELDHPLPTGNEQHDGIRQTTVLLKEASHIIRDYEWNGNKLVGELETLTTHNGKQLLALLHDKTAVGLSMRGMAELERKDNVSVVQAPLYIICFDAVSRPSHRGAIVDFSNMKFESYNMINEGCTTICIGGTCYLPNYFDKLVETEVIKFSKRWV